LVDAACSVVACASALGMRTRDYGAALLKK
jgi:hypothetical protein